MSISDTQDDKGFLSSLCQHLIAIGGVFIDKSTDPPTRKRFIYGGIVMSFHDENWFFVTAGHALEKLSKGVRHGLVEKLSIIDYMSHIAQNKMPIPFSYEHAHEVALFNQENGLDFGIYYLRDYYRNVMKPNVTPLPESKWTRQPPHMPSSIYMMLGLPETLIDDSDPKIGLFKAYLFPVERLGHVPEQYLKNSYIKLSESHAAIRDSLFYGRIPQWVVLPRTQEGRDDIRGMSGCPIFMFLEQDDATMYWIVALQSSWFPDTHVTQAMPVPDIGNYMETFLKILHDYYSKHMSQVRDSTTT